MSVELMHECKKKLLTCITKTEKLIEMFSSSNLEKSLYETVRAESSCKDTRDNIARINQEYDINTAKLKQLVDQGI